MINYETFNIRILKNMYRVHNENLERLEVKLRIAQANYDDEKLIIKAIEKALKKHNVLPNQIEMELQEL